MEEQYVHFVTEYCSNGDLKNWIDNQKRPLNEKEIIDIFAQLVEGISVLHDKNIIHKNIRPENILLNEQMDVKVANFYVDEQVSEQTSAVVPTKASDMFAVGSTLYYAISQHHPFGAVCQAPENNISSTDSTQYAPLPEEYSGELKDLVYRLLDKDPTRRPTAQDLKTTPLLSSALSKLAVAAHERIAESQTAPTLFYPHDDAIAALQCDLDAAHTQLAELQSDLETKESDLQDKDDAFNESFAQCMAYEEAVGRLEDEFSAEQKKVETLEAEKGLLEEECNIMRALAEAGTVQLEELPASPEERLKKLKEKEKEVTEEAAAAAAAGSGGRNSSDVKAFELGQQVKRLKDEVMGKARHISVLKGDVAQRETEIDQLKEDAVQKDKEIEILGKEKEELEKEVERQRAQIVQIQTKAPTAQPSDAFPDSRNSRTATHTQSPCSLRGGSPFSPQSSQCSASLSPHPVRSPHSPSLRALPYVQAQGGGGRGGGGGGSPPDRRLISPHTYMYTYMSPRHSKSSYNLPKMNSPSSSGAGAGSGVGLSTSPSVRSLHAPRHLVGGRVSVGGGGGGEWCSSSSSPSSSTSREGGSVAIAPYAARSVAAARSAAAATVVAAASGGGGGVFASQSPSVCMAVSPYPSVSTSVYVSSTCVSAIGSPAPSPPPLPVPPPSPPSPPPPPPSGESERGGGGGGDGNGGGDGVPSLAPPASKHFTFSAEEVEASERAEKEGESEGERK